MNPVWYLMGLVILIFSYLFKSRRQPLFKKKYKSALILTAHPDDECMFFGPTILQLQKCGIHVSLLCFSTGNADGLGKIRSKELISSGLELGLESSQVVLKDVAQFQDGPVRWDPYHVAKELKDFLSKHPKDLVLTFDEYGVSGHENHISLYYGVLAFLSESQDIKTPDVFALLSNHLLLKYSGPMASILPVKNKNLFIMNSFSDYIKTRQAMFRHSSQLVWFRYLYLIFSSYMWINEFKEIKKAQ